VIVQPATHHSPLILPTPILPSYYQNHFIHSTNNSCISIQVSYYNALLATS